MNKLQGTMTPEILNELVDYYTSKGEYQGFEASIKSLLFRDFALNSRPQEFSEMFYYFLSHQIHNFWFNHIIPLVKSGAHNGNIVYFPIQGIDYLTAHFEIKYKFQDGGDCDSALVYLAAYRQDFYFGDLSNPTTVKSYNDEFLQVVIENTAKALELDGARIISAMQKFFDAILTNNH